MQAIECFALLVGYLVLGFLVIQGAMAAIVLAFNSINSAWRK